MIDFESIRAKNKEMREAWQRIVSPERRSMVTVRLSRELHEALVAKAHAERISLNDLCLAALKIPLREAGAAAP